MSFILFIIGIAVAVLDGFISAGLSWLCLLLAVLSIITAIASIAKKKSNFATYISLIGSIIFCIFMVMAFISATNTLDDFKKTAAESSLEDYVVGLETAILRSSFNGGEVETDIDVLHENLESKFKSGMTSHGYIVIDSMGMVESIDNAIIDGFTCDYSSSTGGAVCE